MEQQTGWRFGMIGRCSQRWIGDWIRYGANLVAWLLKTCDIPELAASGG